MSPDIKNDYYFFLHNGTQFTQHNWFRIRIIRVLDVQLYRISTHGQNIFSTIKEREQNFF